VAAFERLKKFKMVAIARQPFWKNQPLKAQLHMAYDIPTRFHKA
jgi:hypothetical protein